MNIFRNPESNPLFRGFVLFLCLAITLTRAPISPGSSLSSRRGTEGGAVPNFQTPLTSPACSDGMSPTYVKPAPFISLTGGV